MNQPKLVYEKTNARKNCQGLFCSGAYEVGYVAASGDVYMCCPPQLPTPIGNLLQGSFEEAWNSATAQAIRQSILNGDFSYCDHLNCPHLVSETGRVQKIEDVTDPFYKKVIAEGITKTPLGPKEIEPAYDFSCNLSCPSCRHELFVANGAPFDKAKLIHDKVLNEALYDTERFTISGQGDPFASRLYRTFLSEFDQEKYPSLKIWITTNGMLLTPGMWSKIKNSHGAIDVLHVSMNGASNSFAVNQERADFPTFVKNMEFVSELRESGEIPCFSLGYYVLQNNWREMKEAVRLAKRWRADRITFTNITNWGTFSDSEYNSVAVHLKDHPEHGEYLAYLNDPIFRDPVVYLGNIAELLPDDFVDQEPVSPQESAEPATWDWSDLAARLCLSADQMEKGLTALTSLKDETTSIYLRAPSNGGPSPLEYLATRMVALESQPTEDGGGLLKSPHDEFLEYTAFHRDPVTGSTYLAATRRTNRTKWNEFVGLLNPQQVEQIGRLGLNSLKNIIVDYDPFNEQMSRLVAKQVGRKGLSISSFRKTRQKNSKVKLSWPALVSQLQMSRPQSEQAEEILKSFKDEVTSIYQRKTTEDEASPLDYFATRMASIAGAADTDGIEERRQAATKDFLDYTDKKFPSDSDASYLGAISQADKRKWREFVAILNREQIDFLKSQGVVSMDRITIDYDPFGRKVSELIKSQMQSSGAR